MNRLASSPLEFPIDAIIPVDEDTAVVAASIADAIRVNNNSVDAALIAKNKHRMRDVLRAQRGSSPALLELLTR